MRRFGGGWNAQHYVQEAMKKALYCVILEKAKTKPWTQCQDQWFQGLVGTEGGWCSTEEFRTLKFCVTIMEDSMLTEPTKCTAPSVYPKLQT